MESFRYKLRHERPWKHRFFILTTTIDYFAKSNDEWGHDDLGLRHETALAAAVARRKHKKLERRISLLRKAAAAAFLIKRGEVKSFRLINSLYIKGHKYTNNTNISGEEY